MTQDEFDLEEILGNKFKCTIYTLNQRQVNEFNYLNTNNNEVIGTIEIKRGVEQSGKKIGRLSTI